MRVLLYGSTYLAARCCQRLLRTQHAVVGYIPCVGEPTVPGLVPVPVVDPSVPHDVAVSVQYDRLITDEPHGLNLHTGLLPEWGGCDILHHTVRLGAREQGLTLHKMTAELDHGPIIARTTYPVLPGDDVPALYARVCIVGPEFLVSGLTLVERIGLGRLDECQAFPPRVFRRGQVEDRAEWVAMKGRLREMVHGC